MSAFERWRREAELRGRVLQLEDLLANAVYAFDSLDDFRKGRRVVNLDERFAAIEQARECLPDRHDATRKKQPRSECAGRERRTANAS